MKKLLFLSIFLIVGLQNVKSQNTSCSELINYVEKNGVNKDSQTTSSSTWLKTVTAYSVENKLVIIAEIRKEGYGSIFQKYIFCGVPKSNWDEFKGSPFDYIHNYGDNFHKYIMDYKCNCN